MSGAAVYVLRLVCAAVLCALINAIGGEGSSSGLRRLIAGIFLTLTALDPVGEMDLPDMDLDAIHHQAYAAAQDGAQQARQQEADIISDAVRAYIWNKAAALGAEVTVQVELGADLRPCAVTVSGQWSEQARLSLSRFMASELGLGKEVQTWKAVHQSSGSEP